jgi:adenosylcobinamide-GDP ribazoletransferase
MTPNDETADGIKGQAQTCFYDLRLALMFLTRVPFPTPTRELAAGDLSRSMRFYPLIGASVGCIAGLVLMGSSELGLSPLACGIIALAVAAVLTGGLHEDGLADTVDGFAGGNTKERKLSIMRDSQIGAFGTLALIFSVGIRAAILSGMPGPGTALLGLLAAGALSRAPLAVIAIRLEPARKDGLSGALGRPEPSHVITSVLLGSLITFLSLGFIEGGLIAVLWALLATASVTGIIAWVAITQIDGYTGDVMGAVQQLSEIAILIAIGGTLAW